MLELFELSESKLLCLLHSQRYKNLSVMPYLEVELATVDLTISQVLLSGAKAATIMRVY